MSWNAQPEIPPPSAYSTWEIKVITMLKMRYIQNRNVSVLIGSGSTWHSRNPRVHPQSEKSVRCQFGREKPTSSTGQVVSFVFTLEWFRHVPELNVEFSRWCYYRAKRTWLVSKSTLGYSFLLEKAWNQVPTWEISALRKLLTKNGCDDNDMANKYNALDFNYANFVSPFIHLAVFQSWNDFVCSFERQQAKQLGKEAEAQESKKWMA